MKSIIVLLLSAVTIQAFAAKKIHPRYVGSVALNPCQDPKVLADWYSKIGIETHEGKDHGFYGISKTRGGPFFFGIHPKSSDCPKPNSGSLQIVFAIKNFDRYIKEVATRGVTPYQVYPPDPDLGRFAAFKDPDGNDVSLWENVK
jgi:predicted enzyme related to lactoylglutathione lyase